MSKHIPRSKSVLIRNRNFRNIQLHGALDEAQKYSALVNDHLVKSEYQNHMLQTASHSYEFSPIKRSKSALLNSRKSKANPEGAQGVDKVLTLSKIHQGSSEFKPFRTFLPFEDATQRVPETNALLIQRQQQKKYLSERTAELKRHIMNEKKRKAKLSLECSKLMNGRELTYVDTLKKQQDSRRYNIQIEQLLQNNEDLAEDIFNVRSRINNTKTVISDETLTRDQTKQFVFETRILLRREKEMLCIIKQKQSIAFKAMSNQYMVLNQLKEDKAKMLNFVGDDVQQNPVCKPFCRVQ